MVRRPTQNLQVLDIPLGYEINKLLSRKSPHEHAHALPEARRILDDCCEYSSSTNLTRNQTTVAQVNVSLKRLNAYFSQQQTGSQVSGKVSIKNLSGSVDLCLPGVYSLPRHRCRHENIPILRTDEIRRLKKYGGAIIPRHTLPFAFAAIAPPMAGSAL